MYLSSTERSPLVSHRYSGSGEFPLDRHAWLARLKLVEQPAKLDAVGLGPACHFAEYLLASGFGELAGMRVSSVRSFH
jgi:hypothetical protein